MKVVLGHQASHQLVFVGPFGVGKTTALAAVSDVPVVSTDVATNEGGHQDGKNTTTVGLDYGEWHFADGSKVALIGVPGQERFDSMWDALLPQSSAVVLWLFGNRPQDLDDCRFWLDALAARQAVKQLAVAITRLPDDAPDSALDPFRRIVAGYHPFAPVITADPRRQAQVMQTIMLALSTPHASIEH